MCYLSCAISELVAAVAYGPPCGGAVLLSPTKLFSRFS
jgi:hypothetical protein